ncbi:unnamed protein product [Adineta steineri]|uniref:EF-hand domain-containing protein n=1 Tax=Adineta steineri TaxID=433720 RepID=A0A816DZH3_9BILA|nr:unnamed protein product [Adineta steineri]CAF1640232.1 unnamed protein product [Adineta steineri]
MADEIFDQADLNKDQRLDLNEFRNLISQNLGPGASIYTGNVIDGGQYSGGFYDSSSSGGFMDGNGTAGGYTGITDGYTGVADLAGATMNGVGTMDSNASFNAFDQASFASSTGGAGGMGGYDADGPSVADRTAGTTGDSSSSSFEAGNSQQQVQQYATNAQGLYQDPNPQIIRRPAQSEQITYTQNIKIRFLQPPAIPPPGPLIIKEVRPPQPPPPPPLVVRQRAPPRPTPPPLILREKPPPIPQNTGAQTVIRKLPALPLPPRSVIIERLPPTPPKPRDIIIERWIPYNALANRKTIVQRAEEAKSYPKPRNVIIQYEAPQVRVVRQFQRLGVTPENPQEYINRYGTSLFDSQTLVQQARAAGVIEDISPPTNLGGPGSTPPTFTNEFGNMSQGAETSGVGSPSTFETSGYGGQQGNSDFSGFETGQNGTGGGFATQFETSTFSSQGGGTIHGDTSASGYQSYSGSSASNIDIANAAFNAADLNKDGLIDPNEFRQFLGSQLQ